MRNHPKDDHKVMVSSDRSFFKNAVEAVPEGGDEGLRRGREGEVALSVRAFSELYRK